MPRSTDLTEPLIAEYTAALKRTRYAESAVSLIGLHCWTVWNRSRRGRREAR